MPIDAVFSAANTAALIGWIVLIAGPRGRFLCAALRHGLVLALSLLYAVFISAYFFEAEGAGYGDLAQVQAIFALPEAALAGWVHYLAFDLFVGLWIAAEADRRGLNRVVQTPILVATFMFGPVGYLLFHAVLALPMRAAPKGEPS